MVSARRSPPGRFRTATLAVLFVLGFAAASVKLFQVSVLGHGYYLGLARAQQTTFRNLSPSRGEIMLKDAAAGQLVPAATNAKQVLAYAVPKEIQSPPLAAAGLARTLGVDAAELEARLSSSTKRYVVLRRNLTEPEQQAVQNLGLAGVYFDEEEVRFYPERNLLAHVLGFVGYGAKEPNKVGLYGAERYFEPELAGAGGFLAEERDAAGAWIGGSGGQPPEDGTNLVLTIDRSIQYQAREIIKEAVERNGADSGSVVVLDPKTGAVLAMVSYPDFDPNEFGKVENSRIFSNEATVDAYDPGSIFKAVTMAAAIDDGKVTPDTTYTDTGEVTVDKYTIQNSDKKAHGVQTMTQVLEESLNTGTVFAEQQLGDKTFRRYLEAFGFGQPTGIDLPELPGSLRSLGSGSRFNYYTASFGQAITATPLQMARAYGALANGGTLLKPYVVQSKVYPDGRSEVAEQDAGRQVVTPQTANTVTAMLVNVIENGHGKRAAVPGYYIAGKTGTAQVSRTDGKGYQEGVNIGSFVGYGPVEDPKFVAIVRIDNPKTVAFAESTAAPAFGKLAAFILRYLNVPPTREVKN